jgi:hypothetical protein
MGTIRKGVLGGFSGKVGTVVGSSWNGISFMRSLPGKVRNPRTLLQMNQRTKFALTINFLKPMSALLRTGWKLYAYGQSAINAAVSYTLANAITGAYPDYAIDPAKVLISCGSLTPALNATATAANGAIEFTWDDNSGVNDAKQTDMALIAVVNLAKGEVITDSAGSERMSGTQTFALPARWVGDTVEAYIGFISEDGKEVANSVCLGSIVVA